MKKALSIILSLSLILLILKVGDNLVFSETEDLIVTAQYTINSYTVTFKDWDGITTIATPGVDYGSGATAPADPSRTGYTFTGWDVAFDNITEDSIVTAQYTINSYNVTFSSQGGSSVASKAANYNTTITAPAPPTRTGYTFGGWHKESGCVNSWNFTINKVTANTTLYAKWTADAPTYIKGDVTGDGSVDALDFLKVKKHLLGQVVITGYNALAADVTGGGKIDALDLLKIKKYLLGQIVL